jgi:hypothetical protein
MLVVVVVVFPTLFISICGIVGIVVPVVVDAG